MDVRVGLWRKLRAEELMLLNCGVGEDSWESLGLQGDPTSPFWRRSALGFLWKEWCWSWNSSTLDAGRDWGQEEKGTTEDEMAGWCPWLDGCESEWTLGFGDGQGGLACCDSMGSQRVGHDWATELNWTELMGLDAMMLVCWMLNFKPAFSFSSFTSSRGSLVPLCFLP